MFSCRWSMGHQILSQLFYALPGMLHIFRFHTRHVLHGFQSPFVSLRPHKRLLRSVKNYQPYPLLLVMKWGILKNNGVGFDFKRGVMEDMRLVLFFVSEDPDYKSAMLMYLCMCIHDLRVMLCMIVRKAIFLSNVFRWIHFPSYASTYLKLSGKFLPNNFWTSTITFANISIFEECPTTIFYTKPSPHHSQTKFYVHHLLSLTSVPFLRIHHRFSLPIFPFPRISRYAANPSPINNCRNPPPSPAPQ